MDPLLLPWAKPRQHVSTLVRQFLFDPYEIVGLISRMDPLLLPWAKPLQHVSTLVRQFLFDLIFVTENCVLLGIALNSNIKELKVPVAFS
jgi:hypothetical protein